MRTWLRNGLLARASLLSIVLLMAAAGFVAACTAALDRNQYPFAPDSAYYIEAARSLAAGHGLAVTAALDRTDRDSEPLYLWPPGYPLMVSAVAALGVPAPEAALLVTRSSWALLPVLLFLMLRRQIGDFAAVGVAVIVFLSPGVLQEGVIASTDLPYLALALSSAGLLIRGAQPGVGILGSFGTAGLLAGMGYAVRNAGIALVAATLALLLLAPLLRLSDWRTAAQRSAAWCGGAAIAVVPLLFYNQMVLGAVQPYRMPPSTIGLIENGRSYLQHQLIDVSAVVVTGSLAWSATGLALVVVPLAGALAVWLWRARGDADRPGRLALLLFVLYAGAAVATVVLARTKYEWGETINLRHMVQSTWAIAAAVALAFASRVPCAARAPGIARAVGVALVGALVVARLVYAWSDYQAVAAAATALRRADGNLALAARDSPVPIGARTLRQVLAHDAAFLAAARQLPAGAYLATNRGDVIAIETGRAARRIDTLHDPEAVARTLAAAEASLACDRPMFLLVAVDTQLLRRYGPDWQSAVAARLAGSARFLRQTPNWMLLDLPRLSC